MIKIDRDGFKFFGCFAILTILAFYLNLYLFVVMVLLSLWCVYFFRDPERRIPVGNDILVSPADGLVIFVGQSPLPKEVSDAYDGPVSKISIFMNILNVHVNRAVASGTIRQIAYTPGRFFNASFDKASEWNERNSFVLDIPGHYSTVVFTQIAGLIARRIRCDVAEKSAVQMGQRVGIIRFGSRLDVYVPTEIYDINTTVGQKTVAGETIIARVKAKN